MALIGFWTWLFGLIGVTLPYDLAWLFSQLSMILIFVVSLLLIVAYVLLADRKIFAAMQMRRGPNVVGAFGLLQSFADLFKFVFKESVIPAGANKVLFVVA
ncbi:MAG TPA: NADH-quinone oxidoreductase subunit H, partial [Rhizomicrobium sp.]|nr:NADH-quinone oxidoreductase subunit H [Rhizomicrobium sp.]